MAQGIDPHITPDRETEVRTPDAPRPDNRGKRAQDGSGEVAGSGAGAGGFGNPEDFDSDSAGGGPAQ